MTFSNIMNIETSCQSRCLSDQHIEGCHKSHPTYIFLPSCQSILSSLKYVYLSQCLMDCHNLFGTLLQILVRIFWLLEIFMGLPTIRNANSGFLSLSFQFSFLIFPDVIYLLYVSRCSKEFESTKQPLEPTKKPNSKALINSMSER